VQIQCIIDEFEPSWDSIDTNLFDHGAVDAFLYDRTSTVNGESFAGELFSASEIMDLADDIVINDNIFDEREAKTMRENHHLRSTIAHLLEAACYVLFQGPKVLPTDVSLLQDTAPNCLATYIPSMFNVDYIKVKINGTLKELNNKSRTCQIDSGS
jgi:hypothetical protein